MSTFSFRIHEEREILGFDPKTTYNRFCGDSEKECEQPTHWKIVYWCIHWRYFHIQIPEVLLKITLILINLFSVFYIFLYIFFSVFVQSGLSWPMWQPHVKKRSNQTFVTDVYRSKLQISMFVVVDEFINLLFYVLYSEHQHHWLFLMFEIKDVPFQTSRIWNVPFFKKYH